MKSPSDYAETPEFRRLGEAVYAYYFRYGLRETLQALVSYFDTCIQVDGMPLTDPDDVAELFDDDLADIANVSYVRDAKDKPF